MQTSDKKTEILQAASECFARFGYEKTTLDDIGRAVGLNKASLYYYYKNKEAMFAEVLVKEIERAIDEHCVAILEISGCREQIITYLRNKIRSMQELMNVHNVSLEAFRNVQPMFASLFQQVIDKEVVFISSIFERCIDRGEMNPCDTKRIARTILTVVDAIKIKALLSANTQFIDQIDSSALEKEIVFTVTLILDGLIRSPE